MPFHGIPPDVCRHEIDGDRLNLDEEFRAISCGIAAQEISIARNTILLALRSASQPGRHQKNPMRLNSAACNREHKECGQPSAR